MDKVKESTATDAAKEQQDVRQFMDHGQPRQTSQPEPAAMDSS